MYYTYCLSYLSFFIVLVMNENEDEDENEMSDLDWSPHCSVVELVVYIGTYVCT